MITEKEVQVIAEKYEYYLSHSYIDIALSESGKAYFMEFDKNGECNSFYIAENREELEKIIKANICENMECMIDVAAEDTEYRLQRYDLSNMEPLMQIDYEEKLHFLVDKLEMIYKSLRNVYSEVFRENGG